MYTHTRGTCKDDCILESLTEHNVDRIFSKIDTNHNDKIDFSEFCDFFEVITIMSTSSIDSLN